MKKRVVFKVSTFPTVSETFVVTNIIAAINAGYDVKIITNTKHALQTSSQSKVLADYNIEDKIFKFILPKNPIKRYLQAFISVCHPKVLYFYIKYSKLKGSYELHNLLWLKFYYKFRNVDAIHVHFGTAIKPVLDFKKIGFIKSKLIVTFHGFDAHVIANEDDKTLLEDYKECVSHITVNSLYLKKQLIAIGFASEHIQIIPVGLDTTVFDANTAPKTLKTDQAKLISIGRLVDFKGHELGVKAFKMLLDKGYNLQYTILGKGEKENDLKALIKSLDLVEHVQLIPERNQTEIKALLNAHDIFVLPSTTDNNGRRETFGVVSLEAQSMGLPIVGFNTGGFPETLTYETGIVVKDKAIEALAEAIETLITNKEKYQSMSASAIAHVKANFTAEQTVGKYLSLYA